MLFGQIIAIILVIMLLIVWLKEWIWIPFGILALLYIIRWLADLWWYGKDKGKW